MELVSAMIQGRNALIELVQLGKRCHYISWNIEIFTGKIV
jgi:hypothetical protein